MSYDFHREIAEQTFGWRAKVHSVPFIKLDPEWEIAVIPPFAGADSRFLIRKGEARVSVYLDFDSRLGYMPDGAYWEVHPVDGDCARAMLYETEELLGFIRQSIKEQEQKNDR